MPFSVFSHISDIIRLPMYKKVPSSPIWLSLEHKFRNFYANSCFLRIPSKLVLNFYKLFFTFSNSAIANSETPPDGFEFNTSTKSTFYWFNSVDISSYVGGEVKIAFRYFCTFGYLHNTANVTSRNKLRIYFFNI